MKKYFRFIFGLEGFLKNTLTSEECIKGIKGRISKREDNFLKMFKRCIYEYNKSPYLKLLRLAKIDFNDIKSFVVKSGIEGTLEILKNEGVYLTLDEMKGRKDVVRKDSIFRFEENDFNNPFISPAFFIRSGGTMTGGTGTIANISFAFLEQRAQHRWIMFDMHKLFDKPLIIWYTTLGGVEMGILLECAKIGKPPLFFFYHVDKKSRKPSFIAEAAFAYLRYIGRKKGFNFPRPLAIRPTEVSKLSDCINGTIRDYSGCCVRAFVSSAVRVCVNAKRNNTRLDGVNFWASGEPLTNKKREEISSVGANSICQYSFQESGGTVSIGCAKPQAADDMHLFKDLFAVIQHKRKINFMEKSFDAFLFTTLNLEAPKILLNVENGDYGVIEKRECGCNLGEMGFDTHLYNIRSFEKFNGEGMTIFGCDLIKIIEETLVPKYGGSSIDYQFIEEQDSKGSHARIVLNINPNIGVIDERELASTIYKELSSMGPAYRTQITIWQQANTLRIKRAYPIPNKKGKIFPVRIESNV